MKPISLHVARRTHDPRLPDVAERRRRRRTCRSSSIRTADRGPATLGLQSRGAVPREPRLRGAADELPRFDRLRAQVLGSLLQAVGRHDAGRHHRRRRNGSSRRASPTRSASASTAAATAATRRSRAWRYTPDLYACGVDYVGVSNLFTFLKTIPPYWKPYLEMIYEMVGDPEKDKDAADRRRRRRSTPTGSRRRS